MFWRTSRFYLSLKDPLIMGIINTTPDSFVPSSRVGTLHKALAKAEKMVFSGAHIVDIGAESSRPQALPIDYFEEWERLEPLLKELTTWKIPISVDTYHVENMNRALDLGVDIINDIYALRTQSDYDQVINSHCGICLMHHYKDPVNHSMPTSQNRPVVGQVKNFLLSRKEWAISKGIQSDRLVLDPGIGFGKSVKENFNLLNHLKELPAPLLIGWSRKSSLGYVTGLSVEERLVPSIVAAVLAVQQGAKILRVHDVAETASALQVIKANERRDTTQ